MNLFENKKIRCLQAGSNKWYFSVVDVCAAIRGTNYSTARNYWKWLKSKLTKNNGTAASGGQLVSSANQLKLPAADGKLRYTDVMDIEELLRLVQQIPSQKALKFKLWLLALLRAGKNVKKQLIQLLVNQDFAKETKNAVVTALGAVVNLRTVCRREFMLE